MKPAVIKFYPKDKALNVVDTHIKTPHGPKTVKTYSIIPTDTERKKTIEETKNIVFSELKYLNIALTNACNLSCSYCFEQHTTDFGRFDLTTLNAAYDFLAKINDNNFRLFQFFGGEPMIHKNLILEFCRANKEMLDRNKNIIKVSIVSNGLLLNKEFIDEYFGYDFTQIVISLDTHEAETDLREIKQEGIDYIFDMISLIPQQRKETGQVCIRTTINRESVPTLRRFIEKIYECGVRSWIIHPLIFSLRDGSVDWEEDTWNQMHQEIIQALVKFPDMKIQFAEGVGSKGNSNCLVGSDMITVDPSGDYSGCYFFTNNKTEYETLMLGNIFNDQVLVDRYVTFQKSYVDALENPVCQACDLKGYCYQCPAGNLATAGTPFRPDGMCKKIVKLFLVLRNDITIAQFFNKLSNISDSVHKEGAIVLSKSIIHLMYKFVNDRYIEVDTINELSYMLPNYKTILGFFRDSVLNKIDHLSTDTADVQVLIDQMSSSEQISARVFYDHLCATFNLPINTSQHQLKGTEEEEIYFITLLHFLILDNGHFKRKTTTEHCTNRILTL